MVKVKICGITNLPDARAAVEAGADYLGFNFWRRSSRYIKPRRARQIIEELPPDVLSVGVFVNEEHPADVETVADEAGVTALQLHGEESPDYCNRLTHDYVIKVFRADSAFDAACVADYHVDAIMLDAFDAELRGGTGRVIDWSIARRLRGLVPRLFLAGGLSPDNVGEAIAAVQPYAVDACSSLESSPGRKDARRMAAFVRAARSL